MIVFIVFLGLSYAYVSRSIGGTKKQVIHVGNLSLVLEEDENNLTITDAFPTADEVGMIQDAFTFRLINNTPSDTYYILKLANITTGDALSGDDVKYGLTKNGQVTINLISSIVDDTVDTGLIEGNQTLEYSLRLWIKEEIEDESRIAGKGLSLKVNVEQTSEEQENPTPSQSPTPTISPEPATEKVFAQENLGEDCTTYNDSENTFLVGQCANNYIWYSGKLWRVVSRNNETGAIKMVTENSVTAISYNLESSATFENSYVDQWLNQEFLPTLHDYEDYLVTDSIWDVSADSSNAPVMPNGTITVERAVGLLNAYEYYRTYQKGATYTTGYLNNGTGWWLSTWYYSSAAGNYYVRGVTNMGALSYGQPHSGTYSGSKYYIFGVRPTINLKSTVQIVFGNGTLDEPYHLAGDEQETIGGKTLISTRYSGEYVTFNNELYRIVAIEEGLTKIMAVDKPSVLTRISFHGSTEVSNFAVAQIKTDIYNEYYLILEESSKNMIEPNTTWYLGRIGNAGSYHYKATICQTVDVNISSLECEKVTTTATAYIGLPRIGEMFCSQITRNTKSMFWTLTPVVHRTGASGVYYVDATNRIFSTSPNSTFGVHPSLYLKSNVVIASTNTGDGTYEHPYEIELLSE